jgi:hypothetical protein
MSINQNNLYDLLHKYTSWEKSRIKPETDIQYDLGLYGDEAVEFLNEYSQKFNVDISKFDFCKYFHKEGGIFMPRLIKFLSRSNSDLKSISVGDLFRGIEVGELVVTQKN